MGLKTVTYEEFLKFEPCWLEDEEKRKQLEDTERGNNGFGSTGK